MPPVDPTKFFAELEALGEDEARNRLASRAVYGGDKSALVEEWLRRKDQERSDTTKREEISIAREAAAAARDAATEARTANKTARIAIAIAAAAVIVSIIALFQK